MKHIVGFFILLFSFSSLIFSQTQLPMQNTFVGGMGLTWINGDPHYTFRLTPDLSLGKIGVGLDLNLEFDSKGKLRDENFNEFTDYLSVIRYVRYGQKNDKLFVKLGALDYYTLGHGSIMYLYNNSPSFDNRKIGLVFDADFGNYGLESIYGNFAQAGVVGLRGYVRPLRFTSLNLIPIIRNLEVGASFATDFNDNAGITEGYYDTLAQKFVTTYDEDAINIFGLDLGLPIISMSMFSTELYFDYTNILDFGDGFATGILMNLNTLGMVSASLKLERRWNNEHYLPAYFNSFYELERFNVNKSQGTFTSKAQLLKTMTKADDGFLGELFVNVLGMIYVNGSFQKLDKTPDSGILHLEANASPKEAPIVVRAGYDKINIKDGGNVFKLDDRSYLYSEIGYKPIQYLLVSMVYFWTFTPLRDENDDVIGFKPQKKIEPRISFVYAF